MNFLKPIEHLTDDEIAEQLHSVQLREIDLIAEQRKRRERARERTYYTFKATSSGQP